MFFFLPYIRGSYYLSIKKKTKSNTKAAIAKSNPYENPKNTPSRSRFPRSISFNHIQGASPRQGNPSNPQLLRHFRVRYYTQPRHFPYRSYPHCTNTNSNPPSCPAAG